jgi:decaprenylphospho-beta-D-ribofuranose 2-oxidase
MLKNIRLFVGFILLSVSFVSAQIIDDVSRLNPTEVEKIEKPSTIDDVKRIVQDAAARGLTISAAGARHSQGGHISSPGGVVIDISGLNKIVSLDVKNKTICVEPGVTWEQIQNEADKHGLAVKVMQASNIFTVGGSVCVNVHGRDPRFGSLIETIIAVHLMRADGEIIRLSRDENAELFALVVGGYGLFGIITQVELALTDNVVYRKKGQLVLVENYVDFFMEQVKNRPDVGLHFARLILTNLDVTNMWMLIAVNYAVAKKQSMAAHQLKEEGLVAFNKKLFNVYRHQKWLRFLRLYPEVIYELTPQAISRNNAMRPPIKCLEYTNQRDTDILHEYFIPVAQFEQFVTKMRELTRMYSINMLNVTVRYMPKSEGSYLAYARDECFAFVLYINQKRDAVGIETMKNYTRAMIDSACACGGTYYLPYQLHATKSQLLKSYPQIDQFFQYKKEYDPSEVFVNHFYHTYA